MTEQTHENYFSASEQAVLSKKNEMVESIQQAFDDLTKQRNKLIAERDALEKAIEASPEHIALVAREKELKSQCDNLMEQIGVRTKAVFKRFLTDGDDSVYYSRSDAWRVNKGTNIALHVLSAIGKVTPLSKLTDENVRSAVKMLIVMAMKKDAVLGKLKEQNYPLGMERDDINAKIRAMERSDGVRSYDRQIVDLAIRLETLEEALKHPERIKKRADVESARENLKQPRVLKSILDDIEKQEVSGGP